MLAKVSTLLISVGQPHRPLSAGNGGRGRGVPRLPSIEAISAVSSPQTKAPAPMRMSMLKLNGDSKMPLPSRPSCLACLMAICRRLIASGYSRAHVDEALVRADGVGGDGHAFEHAVRIAFQDAAVHERAGVAFVGVADDVFLARSASWRPCPTSGRWEARAAAAAQAALDDRRRPRPSASFRAAPRAAPGSRPAAM